jgi:hypothetical protein
MCSREPAQYGKLIMLVLQGTMHVPVILATQETKEDHKFKATLGNTARSPFKNTKEKIILMLAKHLKTGIIFTLQMKKIKTTQAK